MSGPAIEVSGLSKRYVIEHESRHDNLRDTLHHTARKLWRRFRWGTGFAREEFWALRDVSFSVEPGEVVGIIGRNGAGKSTLLKILSRITEATTGRVTLRGRVASLLEVGTGFHPDLTGRENIFLNGAILGMSRAEIRYKFDEIVAFAEVEKFLDTPVKRYSSGMYVRLAFAVAAHLEPEILIVDEVLAVGDAAFQKKCLGKMQAVAQGSGRTVLFVSHNLPAVQTICGAGVLLEHGRLAERGPIGPVVAKYLRQLQTNSGSQVPQGGRALTLAAVRASTEGCAINELVAAQPSKIQLIISAARPFEDVRITVGFTDSAGQRIFALASFHSGHFMSLVPGDNQVQVDFTPPTLFPGTFSLDVGFYSRAGDALLEAYGAAFVSFLEPDRSPTGEPIPASFGVIRVDSHWTNVLPNSLRS